MKAPLPLLVKLTVPAGVLGVPGEVSFTEAVQVEDWPIWTEAGLQTIVVEVVRLLMLIALEAIAVWPRESFVVRVTENGRASGRERTWKAEGAGRVEEQVR